MGRPGPTTSSQAYLKSNKEPREIKEVSSAYPEKNVKNTNSSITIPHYNRKRQIIYTKMLSVPSESRLQSSWSFPFSSSLTPAIAVFLVVSLFQSILITPCSAEPVVPRAARSSVIRPTRVTYGDIEKLNKTCPGKDTCAPSRNDRNGAMMNDWKKRNCFCDKQCIVYDDCCVDSAYRRDPNVTYKKSDAFECVNLRQYGAFYMKTKCQTSWKDETIRKGCEDEANYFDPISSLPITNMRTGFTYKNYYCALCNNQTFTDRMELWSPRLECPSVGRNAEDTFKNETLDSRLLYRPDQGKWGLQLRQGDHDIFHACNIDPFVSPSVEYIIRPCKPAIRECPKNYTNIDIHRKCLSYTAQVYQQTEGYRNVHCAICNGILPENLVCTWHSLARNFELIFSQSAFSFLFDLNPGTGNEVGKIKKCPKEEVYDPFFQRCRAVLCSPGQVYREGKCIAVTVSTSRPVTNPNLPSDSNDLGDGTDLNALNSNVLESTSPKDSSKITPSQPLDIFEICPKIILSRDEYQILSNGTVYVEQYSKSLSKKEYAVQGVDRLVICALHTENYIDKFGPVWGYLSFAGVLISVIFLILHLIACALVPDLRNLSGKNLASLCVALLLSYSIFLGLPFVSIPSHSCTVMAVILYYGLMASFCWMLVLAWDVSMTLRRATQELRVSSGSQWTRFFFYSTFGWLFPGMLVTVAVVAEFLPTEMMPWPYSPGFGVHNCWFGQKPALLLYFAGPVAFILLLNVILFIDAARLIASTSMGTAKAKACGPSHKNFQLYVRLALLMGISWVLGIIAGYVDVPELWTIFIIFNTLQGLFIFVAFTCSAKTRKVLKTKLCCYSNLPTASWTWSGAGDNQMIRTTSSSSGNTKRSDLEGRHSSSYESTHHPYIIANNPPPTNRSHVHQNPVLNGNHHHSNGHHGQNGNHHHNGRSHSPSNLHHHVSSGNGKMFRSPSTELYRSIQN